MYGKGLSKTTLTLIHALSLRVYPGEILALAGASGSGKSLLAQALLGILPRNARVSGSLFYQGRALTPALQQKYRGREILLIPQSLDYLDPLMPIGRQVRGVFGSKEKQREIFTRYGLDQDTAGLYPFQLSGGMARRALIAAATANSGAAGLIVADEPTPGLSPDLARETLGHFRELADRGFGVLLITHDLDLALGAADRIAVLYAGTAMEIAAAADFRAGQEALRHPYSKALINALPQNAFQPIPGSQPYAGQLPTGCLFAPSCPKRTAACAGEIRMRELRGGEVRCIHAT